jgi:hypothetical protein
MGLPLHYLTMTILSKICNKVKFHSLLSMRVVIVVIDHHQVGTKS